MYIIKLEIKITIIVIVVYCLDCHVNYEILIYKAIVEVRVEDENKSFLKNGQNINSLAKLS